MMGIEIIKELKAQEQKEKPFEKCNENPRNFFF